MTEITLSELSSKLGGQLEGDGQAVVRSVATLALARADQVSFLANARYEKHMADTSAGAVIVPSDYSGPRAEGLAIIRCDDAYFAFRQAMVMLCGFRQHDIRGTDPRAAIDPSAEVADGVSIGPFVAISAGCRIEADTVIYPGVYLGANCRIGRGCIIYPNVTIYDGTLIGDRVTIHANSSIGHDGFGYATHAGDDGVTRHEKIPQTGWVEIADDVEIGACCAIDRATMGPTVIGEGSKFSNLVAIGHGTKMGKHCLLVAQAGIAGSVVVGDYCVFAGQCGIVGHVTIGDGVRVGAQAGVVNDVSPGQEVLGSPAIPRSEARRAIVSASQLPQIRIAVRDLTHAIDAIKRQLGMDNGLGDQGREED